MAIADLVRRGYGATIGKVVTRGYTPLQPPSARSLIAVGSLPSYTAQGGIVTYTNQNLDPIYRGQDATITVTIYESDGYSTDVITGWDLAAYFSHPVTKLLDSDLTKTIGDGVTITNGGSGVCTITLTDDDTDEMDVGDWEWSLWVVDDGAEAPLAIGTLPILASPRSRSSS